MMTQGRVSSSQSEASPRAYVMDDTGFGLGFGSDDQDTYLAELEEEQGTYAQMGGGEID